MMINYIFCGESDHDKNAVRFRTFGIATNRRYNPLAAMLDDIIEQA
jgi:hypothetical protein